MTSIPMSLWQCGAGGGLASRRPSTRPGVSSHSGGCSVPRTTPLIAGFFDTTVGPKYSASSYAEIASRLAVDPVHVLFVSDVTRELAAAAAVGYDTVLSIRPGNRPQPDAHVYPHIRTFDEILP